MMDLLRGLLHRPRRLPLVTGMAALALVAGVAPAVAATSKPVTAVQASSSSRCSVSYLSPQLDLPKVTVESAVMETSGSYAQTGGPAITGLPDFCAVTLVQADPSGNPIDIYVWLPADWNGRFQGVGGAVYECGPIFTETATAIEDRYASATTDCGVPPADALTGAWVLRSSKTLDWPLIDDFAYAGIHDMTVDSKAVTKAYYTSPLRYSYFNGCSTGGREALMEAQRYPSDYNGIVAGAPAINWTEFIPSEIWPELVMNESHDFLPVCVEDAFVESAVQACATTDGVITNPAACDWSPYTLVGLVTPCGTITREDAAVVEKIWDGPETTSGKPLWYGIERGASLADLAETTTTGGVTTGTPFAVSASWLGTWLQRNPDWNWQTLTYAQFDTLFQQSVSEFSSVIATNNPDLTAFKEDGGKILIWHGLADELIFPQGTINYYQRVQRAMGGAQATDSFARLFLASGAQHCASAAGPAPADPLAAVVSWVENGKAPAEILGTTTDPVTNVVTDSRPICAYPKFARYTGHGSTTVASSYTCS